MSHFAFIVRAEDREFEVAGCPMQMVREHWSVGDRYCSAEIRVRCLRCGRWVRLHQAKFRFHPCRFATGEPKLKLRPGSRIPKSCGRSCAASLQYSPTAAPMTSSAGSGGGKTADVAGRAFDSDIEIFGPSDIASIVARHEITDVDYVIE